MIRNPIDRRHANRKDTGCPVFWRRIGIPVAWFLALYPWAIAVCSIVFVFIGRRYFPGLDIDMTNPALISARWPLLVFWAILWLLIEILRIGGMFLLPVGVVWFILMAVAVRRGLVRTRTFIACLAALVLAFVLFPPTIAPTF